jgi:hypothetical protein
MQQYQQLAGLIARLQAVLSEERAAELAPLLQEYTTLMVTLPQATGEDVEADLALLTSLHQEVVALLAVAEQQQATLRNRLAQMGKQKQQVVAYARAQTL